MLQYLVSLSADQNYVFHLITHEQTEFRLTASEESHRKRELRDLNIQWYPIEYHNGKFLILKKLYDFMIATMICGKIRWRYKARTIIGFLPIAAGFSAILAPVLGMKLITYCFEPHSEYMADFGIWSRKSLKYILLKKFEREQLEVSNSVIVPTSYTLELADGINPYSHKFVFPISIDTDKNVFNASFRESFRKENGLEGKRILLYMGKFGGIYYDIPYFLRFIYSFHELENYHVVLISSDAKEIRRFLHENDFDNSFFTVFDFITYDLIHDYISIADLGLVAVPPLPSQKYRTPVKTGLYLSCGIPYLINKGIAEDDLIAEKENVGCVVDDFTNVDVRELDKKISVLLNDVDIADRCRNVALKYRSHKKAVDVLRKVIEDIYI